MKTQRTKILAKNSDWSSPVARMGTMHFAPFTLFVGLVLVSSTTHAEIIYDNGVGGPSNIDVAPISELTHGQSADDFSLTAGKTVLRDVHWSGFYGGGSENPSIADDLFSIRIFADDGGVPQTNPLHDLQQGLDFSLARVPDSGAYSYSAVLDSAIPLTADTTYWLSVVDNTDNDPQGDNWFWGALRDVGNNVGRFDDSIDVWLVQDNRLDFTLTGGIPEPSTFALGWLASLLMFTVGRRA